MSSSTATSVSATKRRNALRDAISVFRDEWARDHLLGKVPATDAAILSSPLQQLHMCSFESDMRFDPVDQDENNTNCGTMTSSESVMIPAYTKDGINVGYCLSETAGLSSNNFINCHNGTAIQHFIVRERDGVYVGLTRHPDIELLMHLSSEHRTKRFYCFAFPGKVFSNLVGRGYRNITHLEHMLCATVHFQYVKECSICGASSHVPCHCSARLSTSKSPLDLPAIQNNIADLHLVHAKGNGSFDLFANGVPKITTPLNVNVNAVPCVIQARAQRFVRWAVADVLKNAPIEVSRGLTFPIDVEHDNREVCDSPSTNTTSVSDLVRQDLLTIETVPEISQEQDSVLQQSSNISNSPAQRVMPTFEQPTNAFDTQISTESVFPESSVTITTEVPLPTQISNRRVILPRSRVLAESVFPLPANIPSASRKTALPVPSRALSIAPRGTADILPHSSGITVPDEETIKKMADELRQWKAYHRKIRNRESAIRSNQRRRRRKHAARNQQDPSDDKQSV